MVMVGGEAEEEEEEEEEEEGGSVGISDILQGQCKIKDRGCRASDHIFTKDTL